VISWEKRGKETPFGKKNRGGLQTFQKGKRNRTPVGKESAGKKRKVTKLGMFQGNGGGKPIF